MRGYGPIWAREILENSWNRALGEPLCHQTRVNGIRRGVLNVTVAHSSVLEELMAFRKTTLLQSLQASGLGMAISDIQFQIGSIACDTNKSEEASLASSAEMNPASYCSPIEDMQTKRPWSERGT
jgi:hypothetical protein